jgi:hypothetical protein
VASPQVLDEGVTCRDHPGVAVSLEALHRSESGLESPVVRLDPVVGVLLRLMERSGQQLIKDRRVDGSSLSGDLDRTGSALSLGKVRVRTLRQVTRRGTCPQVQFRCVPL